MLPVSERQKVEGGEKGGSETQMIDANPGLAFGNMPSSIGKDAYGLKSSPQMPPKPLFFLLRFGAPLPRDRITSPPIAGQGEFCLFHLGCDNS
jgi:hypothetical protein